MGSDYSLMSLRRAMWHLIVFILHGSVRNKREPDSSMHSSCLAEQLGDVPCGLRTPFVADREKRILSTPNHRFVTGLRRTNRRPVTLSRGSGGGRFGMRQHVKVRSLARVKLGYQQKLQYGSVPRGIFLSTFVTYRQLYDLALCGSLLPLHSVCCSGQHVLNGFWIIRHDHEFLWFDRCDCGFFSVIVFGSKETVPEHEHVRTSGWNHDHTCYRVLLLGFVVCFASFWLGMSSHWLFCLVHRAALPET